MQRPRGLHIPDLRSPAVSATLAAGRTMAGASVPGVKCGRFLQLFIGSKKGSLFNPGGDGSNLKILRELSWEPRIKGSGRIGDGGLHDP